jgi:hypothetical protein
MPDIEEPRGKGQPSKYRPEYCEMLIEHMRGGLSFESFGARIRVTKKTMYEWTRVHPEFQEAKELGEVQSLLWWENIGKAAMMGGQHVITHPNGKTETINFKNFNTTVWIFAMKNRHGWRDKQETISVPEETQSKVVVYIPDNSRDKITE